MRPIVFGSADRPLVGLYHPPAGGPRDAGVLLCYPAPQEYQLTHWAVRKLAGQLARAGFHVFRFDYTGTGDSAGDLDDVDLGRWCGDVRAAATELADVAGVSQLSCVGYRLGASLAALACGEGCPVLDALVLWDPVVRGRTWLADCRALEDRLYTELLVRASTARELLGYPLSAALVEQLRELDLLAVAAPPAGALHLVVSAGSVEVAALAARWREGAALGGPPVTYACVREEAGGGQAGALLSSRVLSTIVEALTEAKA